MNNLYIRTSVIPANAHRESFVDTIGCTSESLTRLVIIAKRMRALGLPCDLFVAELAGFLTVVGALIPDVDSAEVVQEWREDFDYVSSCVDENYLELRDTYGEHDLELTFGGDTYLPEIDFPESDESDEIDE